MEEILLPSFDFKYADKFLLDTKENTLVYQQQALKVEKKFWYCDSLCPLLVRTTLTPLPKTQYSFTNVLVVPYRVDDYNIYHIVEGVNSVLRYYFKYGTQFKECRFDGF